MGEEAKVRGRSSDDRDQKSEDGDRMSEGKRNYMTVNGKLKVLLVAGTRPNFMKTAPVYREVLTRDQVDCRIVHTGQHYDYEMSQAFFEDLELPEPDFFLETGSGSHAVQTGKIMVAFEELCEKERPDLVMVGKRQRSEVGGQREDNR